ncbi:hypothetical protein BASA81_002411 [Batrachochytrium salamandrivorans]|nr:hypothetical protein BASA81_002411 [Batrachochytrium salamandrivorans]
MRLAASFSTSAALDEGGAVFVWGRMPRIPFVDSPSRLDGLAGGVSSLHSSSSSTLLGMVHRDGSQSFINSPSLVNDYERTVAIRAGEEDQQIPVLRFALPFKATGIAIGCEHVLVLDDVGQVYSWGRGNFGVLGHGNFCHLAAPTKVSKLEMVQSIACGAFHSLCSTALGEVYSWGNGGQGRLGLGSLNEGVWEPTKLANVENAASVFAGDSHSAYVSDCRTLLFVWGNGSFHRLGVGYDCSQVSFPTRSEYICALEGKIAEVSLGITFGACLVADALYMWGDASLGKLGPEVLEVASIPRLVVESGVSTVSCGTSHTLVGMKTGAVLAFGEAAWCGKRKQDGNRLPLLSPRDCQLEYFAQASSVANAPSYHHHREVVEVDDVTDVEFQGLQFPPELLSPNAIVRATGLRSNRELCQQVWNLMHSDRSISYSALERELQDMEAVRIELLELVVDVLPQTLFESQRVEDEMQSAIQQYMRDSCPGNNGLSTCSSADSIAAQFAMLLTDPQRMFDFWQSNPSSHTKPLLIVCGDLYPVQDSQVERLFHALVGLISRSNLEREFQRKHVLTKAFLLQRNMLLKLVLAVYSPKLDGNASSVQGLIAELDNAGMDLDFDPLAIEARLTELELIKRKQQQKPQNPKFARAAGALAVVYLKPFQPAPFRQSYDEAEAVRKERVKLFSSRAKVRGMLEAKLLLLTQLLDVVHATLTRSLPFGLHMLFADYYKNMTWTFIQTEADEIKLMVMRTLFHFWCVPALLAARHGSFVTTVDELFEFPLTTTLAEEVKFGIAWFSHLQDLGKRFRTRLIATFPFTEGGKGEDTLFHLQLARECYRERALILYPSPGVIDLVRRISTGDVINGGSSVGNNGEARVTVNLGHTLHATAVVNLEQWIRAQHVSVPNAGVIRIHTAFLKQRSSVLPPPTSEEDTNMLQKLVDNFNQRQACLQSIQLATARLGEIKSLLEDLLVWLKQTQLELANEYGDVLTAAVEKNAAPPSTPSGRMTIGMLD